MTRSRFYYRVANGLFGGEMKAAALEERSDDLFNVGVSFFNWTAGVYHAKTLRLCFGEA